ncbi:MAG TPA: cupredoxin domain-containing protein [Acidimicrobiia bacterium]|nr:cupredoxin domain-containing protein [Acidimicrobiia bacterium]
MVLAAALAGAALAGGLAWLVSPGAAAGPTTIGITAHHSRFEPDRVKVKPNSTVRFVVHNADPIDHEFIIGPPETHALHERGTPHFHTGVTPGEITVPAGATVETSWTFGPSGSPAVAYGCHLAGHWDYGMHGLATIR